MEARDRMETRKGSRSGTRRERFLLGRYGSIISVARHRNRASRTTATRDFITTLGGGFQAGEIKYNYRRTYRRTGGNDGNNSIAGDSYVKSNNDNNRGEWQRHPRNVNSLGTRGESVGDICADNTASCCLCEKAGR